MIMWVGCAALIGAAAVLALWATHRTDRLGSPRRPPFVSVGLLLVVALTAGYLTWRHTHLESQLSAASSALVGQSVTVDCQTWGSSMVDVSAHLGYVRWGADGAPERRTLLKRDVCGDLRGYLSNPNAAVTDDRVIAVHVLAHESMHMAGEKAEPITECQAMQRNAALAHLLGASPESARQLAVRYWREFYPRQATGYTSRDCAPGGLLDERLPDPPWTTASASDG